MVGVAQVGRRLGSDEECLKPRQIIVLRLRPREHLCRVAGPIYVTSFPGNVHVVATDVYSLIRFVVRRFMKKKKRRQRYPAEYYLYVTLVGFIGIISRNTWEGGGGDTFQETNESCIPRPLPPLKRPLSIATPGTRQSVGVTIPLQEGVSLYKTWYGCPPSRHGTYPSGTLGSARSPVSTQSVKLRELHYFS